VEQILMCLQPNIATFAIGLVGSKVQEGKNTIKGTTLVSGHSLKLHFCMFERSQVKQNSLDCHRFF